MLEQMQTAMIPSAARVRTCKGVHDSSVDVVGKTTRTSVRELSSIRTCANINDIAGCELESSNPPPAVVPRSHDLIIPHASVRSDEVLVVRVLAHVAQGTASTLDQLGAGEVGRHAFQDEGNASLSPHNLLYKAVVEGEAPQQIADRLLLFGRNR